MLFRDVWGLLTACLLGLLDYGPWIDTVEETSKTANSAPAEPQVRNLKKSCVKPGPQT